MATPGNPVNVMCSPDMLRSARNQYPSSVKVVALTTTEETTPGGFSSPSARDDAWQKTQKRVAAAILAEKPSDTALESDRSKPHLSPGAKAFEAEFKLPGRNEAGKGKQAATAFSAKPAPPQKAKDKSDLRSDATRAFVHEFKLPTT